MRQLVQNGVWQVPVDERPNGWQSLGVREPSQTKIVAPGELDIRRCDCGRSFYHNGRCRFRVLRDRHKPLNLSIAEFKSELVPAVKKGAEWLGADGYLVTTALVMLAGMYTRDIRVLAKFTGVAPIVVEQIALNLEAAGIFKSGGGVLLGEMDGKDGDMEFWLVAMAGVGTIQLIQEDDGRLLFAHAGYQRGKSKAAGR